MARTTKRGTCDLCGANSNVGTNHGSKVCSSCSSIQAALSKRPQSVANAIRAMGKTEELLGHLIPAGGLAVKVTADLLQEISGIVGYDGEDPDELVEAVRAFEDRRPAEVPDCAECDAAEALLEIAELVGKRGASSGLVVEAVRESVETAATLSATGDFLRGDLLRACGLEMDDTEDGEGWDVAAAAAIQTIAELINRHVDMMAMLTEECIDSANLRNEIARLNGQTHSESAEVTALRMNLTLAEHSRDKWESRAVQAESNVETLESELRNREDAPAAPCASTTYLLDIALRALRGEGPDADQLATIIDAARRAA